MADEGSIWRLANQQLRQGAWLITDTALMQGVRNGSMFVFAGGQTAPGMFARVFSPAGLEQCAGCYGQSLSLSRGNPMARLRQASLYRIGCCIRDEIDGGLTGVIPNGAHVPAATALFRESVPLERSNVEQLRSAVNAKLPEALRQQIGSDFALVLVDGAVHKVPTPRPRLVHLLLGSRPRSQPVSILEVDIKPLGLNLDALLHLMDVAAEQAIRTWQQQTVPSVGKQLDRVRAFLAEDCTSMYWDGARRIEFYQRGHYRVCLTPDYVEVEKMNEQPWYIAASNGDRYRFPGTHLQIAITPLGEIPAVKVRQPRFHRFIGNEGHMCLPAAGQLIPTWLQDPSLRLGEVVDRVFGLYEHALRVTSVMDGVGGPNAFERLKPYKVSNDTPLAPDALFYPSRAQVVVRAAQSLRGIA